MKKYHHQALAFIAILIFGSQLAACSGGSDPFAAVPDESPAPGFEENWTVTYTITEMSGCEEVMYDSGTYIGDSYTTQVNYSTYWDCDIYADESNQPEDTDSSDSEDSSYETKCEAGGNMLVIQTTSSGSEGSCSGTYSETTTITLADDGETLSGTEVTGMSTSGCTVENDGIDDVNCHITTTITGEKAEISGELSQPIDYVDGDGDGYYHNVSYYTDCNDNDAEIYPYATEIPNDGIDQNCDDEDLIVFDYDPLPTDQDGDNSAWTLDCNDTDATIYPGATEVADDGIDQDCDGYDLVTPPVIDTDGDSILDDVDNCVDIKNKSQIDTDGDLIGDKCDTAENPLDPDNDQIEDASDNCPTIYNLPQHDPDGDGLGNACDDDDDGDTILDDLDNCRLEKNVQQTDTDVDGKGNVCDGDKDDDTFKNKEDNCPLVSNIDQLDSDWDTIGDVCDED